MKHSVADGNNLQRTTLQCQEGRRTPAGCVAGQSNMLSVWKGRTRRVLADPGTDDIGRTLKDLDALPGERARTVASDSPRIDVIRIKTPVPRIKLLGISPTNVVLIEVVQDHDDPASGIRG